MKLTRISMRTLLAAGLFLAFTVSISAQVQKQTTATEGTSTHQVKVERGEVVYVSGNDVVFKGENGEIRHVTVPAGATAVVDGKTITVADLKPGMVLQKTITTTTTPKVITEVQTIKGTVFHVVPPISVILTLENGENQSFKIPKGQKFNVDGNMVDAFGLKKGMRISATKVVETPLTVLTQRAKVTGTMPPPPEPIPADTPIMIAEEKPAAAPAPAPEPAPAALPKTASPLPLIGLLGVLSLVSGLGMKAVRLGR